MIRAFKENDLSVVMQIWLDTNIKTHSFISKYYWMDNYDMVKKILPQAEIYVYEDTSTKEIEGFIGLFENLDMLAVAILMIGLVIGIGCIVAVQRKYNNGLF